MDKKLNEQQTFWAKAYANGYIEKNKEFDFDAGARGWKIMLGKTDKINSVLECGCNIGRNIRVLNSVLPEAKKSIIEISEPAYKFTTTNYTLDRAFNGPIVDSDFLNCSFDLTFTMGVLIHIEPNDLLANMQKLFDYSSKYILIAEYFNKIPVMIEYQGEQNKLFKRDFGKLFIDNFDVKVIDTGFLWSHNSGDYFDDLTWWLFEKK